MLLAFSQANTLPAGYLKLGLISTNLQVIRSKKITFTTNFPALPRIHGFTRMPAVDTIRENQCIRGILDPRQIIPAFILKNKSGFLVVNLLFPAPVTICSLKFNRKSIGMYDFQPQPLAAFRPLLNLFSGQACPF